MSAILNPFYKVDEVVNRAGIGIDWNLKLIQSPANLHEEAAGGGGAECVELGDNMHLIRRTKFLQIINMHKRNTSQSRIRCGKVDHYGPFQVGGGHDWILHSY